MPPNLQLTAQLHTTCFYASAAPDWQKAYNILNVSIHSFVTKLWTRCFENEWSDFVPQVVRGAGI